MKSNMIVDMRTITSSKQVKRRSRSAFWSALCHKHLISGKIHLKCEIFSAHKFKADFRTLFIVLRMFYFKAIKSATFASIKRRNIENRCKRLWSMEKGRFFHKKRSFTPPSHNLLPILEKNVVGFVCKKKTPTFLRHKKDP
jgi:hypothetical protein